LVAEYKSKLAEIVNQLEVERVKAQNWLTELATRQQQLEFDKETFGVRAKLDELPQSQVTRKLQSIELELTKIIQIIAGLRAVLGVSSPSLSGKPHSPRSSRRTRSGICPNCGGTVPARSKWCYHCGNMVS
jgi:hypothetical protein